MRKVRKKASKQVGSLDQPSNASEKREKSLRLRERIGLNPVKKGFLNIVRKGYSLVSPESKWRKWLRKIPLQGYFLVTTNSECRKGLYYLILFTAGMVFMGPISAGIAQLGQSIFATWKANLGYDLLFIGAALGLVLFQSVRFQIRYQTQGSQTLGLGFAVFYYLVIRSFSPSLSFVYMECLPFVTYSDVIAVGIASGPILQMWNLVIPRRGKGKNDKSAASETRHSAIDFEPILNEEEDILDRTEFVKLICSEILEKDKNAAVSIGIVGGWGEGKTTILNLVKKRLKQQEEVIVMEFSPWLVPNKADYAQEFLQSLQVAVAPYSGLAKQSIQAFEDALHRDAGKGVVASLGIWLKEQLLPSWTRKSLHERLAEAVSSLEKKIVVNIDDLDRLTADELREAFRIIRNIGCIPGVLLISAFDRKHLIRLMDGKEYGDPASFLQKIFPVCHDVPAVSIDKIRDLLLGWVENQNESAEGSVRGIKDYIREKRWVHDKEAIALPANMTIREAKIFAKELIDVPNEIGEEVYIRDLILISLIKVKYPILFHLIREKLAGIKETISPNKANSAPIKEVFPSADVLLVDYGVDKVGFELLEKLFKITGDTKKPNVPDSMRIRNERGFRIYFCADNTAVKFSLVKEVLRSSREKLAEKFGSANPQAYLWIWQQMLDFLVPSQDEDDDYVLNYFWVSICCNKMFWGNSLNNVVDYAGQAKRFEGALIKRLPEFVGIPDPYRDNAVMQLGKYNELLVRMNSGGDFGSSIDLLVALRDFAGDYGDSSDLLLILHALLTDYASDPASDFTSVEKAFKCCIQSIDPSDPDNEIRIYTKESLGIIRRYIKSNLEKYLCNFLSFRNRRNGKEVNHYYLHFDIFSDAAEQGDFLKLVTQYEKKHNAKTNLKRFFADSDREKCKMTFNSPEDMREFFEGTIYEAQMEKEVFGK